MIGVIGGREEVRDPGGRFPGSSLRFNDARHVSHRFVHEEGWRVE